MKTMTALALATTLASAAAAQTPAPASFCARAAVGLGMQPVASAKPPMYRKRLLGLGSLLVGGSTSVMLGVEAPGEPTPDAYARLSGACRSAKAGITCTVTGPMTLNVDVKGNRIKVEAREGERAEFRMAGSRLECVDQPPV